MTDENFWRTTNTLGPSSRQQKRGERVGEFRRRTDHFTFELREHGEWGTETQILMNGQLLMARMFRDDPELGFKGRALAIAWAEEWKVMENGTPKGVGGSVLIRPAPK